jgi:non-homologous end joining protein Ku
VVDIMEALRKSLEMARKPPKREQSRDRKGAVSRARK